MIKDIYSIENGSIKKRKITHVTVDDATSPFSGPLAQHTVGASNIFLTEEEAKEELKKRLEAEIAQIKKRLQNI